MNLSKDGLEAKSGLEANQTTCDMYYCFVCDCIASECKNWTRGGDVAQCISEASCHCQASNQGVGGRFWVGMRDRQKGRTSNMSNDDTNGSTTGLMATSTNAQNEEVDNASSLAPSRPGFCCKRFWCKTIFFIWTGSYHHGNDYDDNNSSRPSQRRVTLSPEKTEWFGQSTQFSGVVNYVALPSRWGAEDDQHPSSTYTVPTQLPLQQPLRPAMPYSQGSWEAQATAHVPRQAPLRELSQPTAPPPASIFIDRHL